METLPQTKTNHNNDSNKEIDSAKTKLEVTKNGKV